MPRKTTALVKAASTSIAEVATAAKQIETLSAVLKAHEHLLATKKVTPAERPAAESALVAVRTMVDTAEKGRVMLTKPLLDRKKEIDSVYKVFKDQAEQLDQHVWRLIQASKAEEQAAMVKAAEREARKAEKIGAPQLAEDIRALAKAGPQLTSLSEQTIVRAEVTDKAALVAALLNADLLELIEFKQAGLNALVRSGVEMAGLKRVEEVVGRRVG